MESLEERNLLAVDLLVESFEAATPTGDSTLVADPNGDIFHNGSSDFWTRTDGTTPPIATASTPYSGQDGSFYFAGEDLDDKDGSSTKTIEIQNINIAGHNNLAFTGLFAADGVSGGTPRFDPGEGLLVQYSVDGGAFTNGLAFRAVGPAGVNNTNIQQDTDFDGFGDGVQLIPAFASFGFSIPGTGTNLTLRVTGTANGSSEEFAFDFFKVTGDVVSVNQAPTATLTSAPDVGEAEIGQTSYSFDVTYIDPDVGGAIDFSDIDTSDVTVTGPGGPLTVTGAVASPMSDASPIVVTYTVATPDPGGWRDTLDDGVYTIDMNASEVSDTDASPLSVAAGNLGSFTVAATNTNPTVNTVNAATVTNANLGQTSYSFTVEYTDVGGIDTSSIGAADVTVTGPGGPLTVTGGTTTDANGSTSVIATYTVDTPDNIGGWSPVDDGTYNIAVVASEVDDVLGASVASGGIGSFLVDSTLLLIESFEAPTPTGDTGLVADPNSDIFYGGPDDFWTRTDGANPAIATAGETPGNPSYAGQDGSFYFAGEDLDHSDGSPTKTLEIQAINIAGFENVTFTGAFAADAVSGGTPRLDPGEGMLVEYSVDGGAFTNGLAFRAVGPAGVNNTNIQQDTDFDGFGDGAALTPTFADFGFSIPSGTNLTLRITGTSNSSSEEFAFDFLRINGDPSDAVAPVLESFERQVPATSPTSADSLTFRATFDEAVVNVGTDDFVANGSTALVTLVAQVSGNVYDVTISGGDLPGLDGTVGLDLAPGQDIEDTAGNALPNVEPTIDEEYVVDNTAPTVFSIERMNPANSPTNADSLSFLVTFSEELSSLGLGDIVVTGTTATISSIVTSDFIEFVYTISGGDLAGLNGVVGLDVVGSPASLDLAGNQLVTGEPTTDETYLLDNIAPTLLSFERQSPTQNPTDADVLVFRATFDEDVSNIDPADFSANGTTATVTAVTPVSGSVYDVTVSGGDLPDLNGTVGIDLAGGQNITDLAGNALPPGEPAIDETYDVENPKVIFISSDTGGVVDGIAFSDEDILAYNVDIGQWSMYFDGSNVGLSSKDVNAFEVQSDGSILLSIDSAITELGGLGRVDDSDVVRFIPTTLGVDTSGSFEWYLDGSDVGLSPTSEDITALSLDPSGRLVVSTVGNFIAPATSGNVSGTSDDLIVFHATQLGQHSIGTWETYFDGSDIGLSNANIYGVSLQATTTPPTVHLNTKNNFSVNSGTSLSGDNDDIFTCNTSTLGDNTSCSSITQLFDMDVFGLGSQNLDGIQFAAFTGNEIFPEADYYFSSDGGGTIGGVTFTDDDIFVQDGSTGAWSLHFDGSDVGISADVNAFHIEPSGDILMSFKASQTISGVGSVGRQDIVRFSPTSIGDTTAGTFSLFFDGSDVGLTTSGENIDAIGVDPITGDLVISTLGSHIVPGSSGNVSGNNRDLIRFVDIAFGSNTVGTWAPFQNGASVALNSTSEDISGLWFDGFTGDSYVNTLGSYSVPGLSGSRADVFSPSIPERIYDGVGNGIGNFLIDGIFVEMPAPLPLPAPIPLVAPSSTNAPGDSPTLSADELDAVVDAAILRLVADGPSSSQVATSNSVTASVADLSGLHLGAARATQITIDVGGAGRDWFVDPSPLDDSEFRWLSESELIANAESDAKGRVDLLTVVMHELGHVLGLEHGDEAGLMGETLERGPRHVDDIFAGF